MGEGRDGGEITNSFDRTSFGIPFRRPMDMTVQKNFRGYGYSDGVKIKKATESLIRSLEFLMERETGFEPATSTLARLHSTTELFPHSGARCVERVYV